MAIYTPLGFLFKGPLTSPPPCPSSTPQGPAQQRIRGSGILIWMQFSSFLPLTGLRTHSSIFQGRAECAILQAGACQDGGMLSPVASLPLFQGVPK